MGEASRPPGYASRTNFAVLPVSTPCGSPPPGSLASAHRSAGETFLCIALRCRGSISWRGADLGRGDGVSREGRVEEREPARAIEADFDQVLRLVAQHAREAALHAACVVSWGANIPSAGQAALRRPVGPSRARSSEASIARLGRTKRSEDPADMTKSARTKGIAVFV